LTDRGYLEKVIASLGNRIFLLHNINQGQPKLFQSRWALSFLRGPMTREEVSRITQPIKDRDRLGVVVPVKLCNHCGSEVPAGAGNRCPGCGKNPWDPVSGGPVARMAAHAPTAAHGAQAPAAPAPGPAKGSPPVLPPDVNQFFLPVASGSGRPGQELEYQPWLLGFAEVVFQFDKRAGEEHRLALRLLARAPEVGIPVDWDKAIHIPIEPIPAPQANARWAAVPESVDTGRKIKALEKGFAEHLYSSQKLLLWENRELELVSKPGELVDVFRKRCRQTADQQRDAALQLEQIKFTPKIEAAKQSTSKGKEDRVARLEADLQAKKDEITELYRRIADEAVELMVKPRKIDIRVTHFGLAWAPFWRAAR
jgi:hypothetical protein